MAKNPRYSNIHDIAAQFDVGIGHSLEALVRSRPDLVIMTSFNRVETIRQIENLGIPVFVLGNFTSFNDISSNIKSIGSLIGKQQNAQQLIEEFLSEIKPQISTAATRKTWTALPIEKSGLAWGRKTLCNEIVQAAGLKNILGSKTLTGWSKLSREFLATLNPDWIITSGNPEDYSSFMTFFKADPIFSQMVAIKKGRLIIVPTNLITSASHHVAKAVQYLRDELARKPQEVKSKS